MDPPAKIYQKYYFFDIKNTKQVESNMETPVLIEKGPYTYSMKVEKRNVNFIGSNLVSYAPVFSLKFEESLSVGSENDALNFLNVPVLV
jgi:hypothetical protein